MFFIIGETFMKPIGLFEEIHSDMESLFRSRLQIQILLSLGEGMKTLSDLREITGSSSQALLPLIRKLERNHLISTTKNDYCLTPLGIYLTKKIERFVLSFSLIKNEGEFWNNHYLNAIPHSLLRDLGDLHYSKIVFDTNADIFRVYHNFLKIVKEARHIHGVSSIISIGHADALAQKVREGTPTVLLVSRDVSVQMHEDPYLEKMKSLKPFENFSVGVITEPVFLGVTVTDSHLSLGLYKNDKITYDATTDIFSEDQKAIAWGERLFEYYRVRSVPVQF